MCPRKTSAWTCCEEWCRKYKLTGLEDDVHYTLILLALFATGKEAKKRLRSPNYISPAMRVILDNRMQHHGEAAMRLSMSVVLLDYADAWKAAQGISEQATLARPRPSEADTLNAALPPLFFDLQDELRVHADELQKAAEQRDPKKLGAAYGRLTSTCVACHAVYLQPDPTTR